MKKYLTKSNFLNVLLFVQFIIINIVDYFDFDNETLKIISFLGLIVGYFININKKSE